MDSQAKNQATIVASATDTAHSEPTVARTTIHWADSGPSNVAELEQKFEMMRARNWVTDRMVQQYMKHWHCTREAALERLLAKVGA